MGRSYVNSVRSLSIASGSGYPLGATVDEEGTNFALFSANATKVELCLFDQSGEKEIRRIELPEFSDDVWHGYVHGLKSESLYGYRVYGPFEPHNGHRFNPDKLLLDPYAKQLKGAFVWSDTHLSYDPQNNHQDLTLDNRDNAKYLPKCVVKKVRKRRKNNLKEKVNAEVSTNIIYEIHVKGFTQANQKIPTELRGTFKGLADKNVVDYLLDLGVTSVELLPVCGFFDEVFLLEKGLKNYWGYNSIAFFSLEPRYCASDDLSEFSSLVNTFHNAGIEVILDVVYNHTAESDHLGPTYSFKGIDNASYYRLQDNDKRFYKNYSGCGNTLNLQHPRVLQLVMDSLRYWVEVMGVDGFRFDLASVLGRGRQGKDDFVDYSSFFAAMKQDPVLANIKLIAEPWDVGDGGYQLGKFPKSWLEWNDQFRDSVRRFWRGDAGMLPELAKRLHGSQDIFSQKGRRPYCSVNYVTSHDGYTLHDLVSYKQRHNEINGEHNKDGHVENFSENYGVEGLTNNPVINQFREKQKRNILATLLLAQGTPMLLAGDEFGNSQSGNNNAYCQDNQLTWLNWSALNICENKQKQTVDAKHHVFMKKLIQLRKEHPLLNRENYQHGDKKSHRTGLLDISWFNPSGQVMSEKDWHDRNRKCLVMLLGNVDRQINLNKTHLIPNESCSIEYGQDDGLLIILNAHDHSMDFVCPALDGFWKVAVDTADEYVGIDSCLEEQRLVKKISKPNSNSDLFGLAVDAYSCVVLIYKQYALIKH